MYVFITIEGITHGIQAFTTLELAEAHLRQVCGEGTLDQKNENDWHYNAPRPPWYRAMIMRREVK